MKQHYINVNEIFVAIKMAFIDLNIMNERVSYVLFNILLGYTGTTISD